MDNKDHFPIYREIFGKIKVVINCAKYAKERGIRTPVISQMGVGGEKNLALGTEEGESGERSTDFDHLTQELKEQSVRKMEEMEGENIALSSMSRRDIPTKCGMPMKKTKSEIRRNGGKWGSKRVGMTYESQAVRPTMRATKTQSKLNSTAQRIIGI